MRSEVLYEAMGDISERHIQEAKQRQPVKKTVWKKWQAVAVCAALLVFGFCGYYALNTTVIGGVKRHYKMVSLSSSEIGKTWPWEYMTIREKYGVMTFEGREYRLRGNGIGMDLLGETLGPCTASGYDTATQLTYTETFEVRKINSIRQEYLVAVEMEETYYVAICADNGIPSTFGEVLDIYGLPQTLEFSKAGQLAIQDDSYIWEVLSECRDAKMVEDSGEWNPTKRKYLSFAATSEALGVYKRVFRVSEDGYIWTNIFEYAYAYEIGEEAAEKILSYVKSHSTVAKYEPFEYKIAGTLVAIEEGYVLIDDSVMCTIPWDGMVFKLPTDEIWIRRSIELSKVKVGDIVVVSFRGDIDVVNDNTIKDAVSIEKGILHNGTVAVLE